MIEITPAYLIAEAGAINKPKYRHKATGVIANIYFISHDERFIKYYWVVPGIPDNFIQEDVENEKIFEKC